MRNIMNKIPMTAIGAKLLQDELQRLKSVERPEIIKAISEARAHGDLKENAEYHAAKERQSFIEGRIVEVESKLSHAQIIDVTVINNIGKVIFGATVSLLNVSNEETIKYQIVGEVIFLTSDVWVLDFGICSLQVLFQYKMKIIIEKICADIFRIR